jgi:Fe2+ transport system protein FeoA
MTFKWKRLFPIAENDSSRLKLLNACDCETDDSTVSATLSQVEPGNKVKICCLEGGGPLIRRLAEMGFIPGTEVEVLRRAPFADPIEFQLRGYLVSLRREDADRVHVRLTPPRNGSAQVRPDSTSD